VPIRPFLFGPAFDHDTVAAMGIAFDRARRSFGLMGKDDALTKTVAQKIIEAAGAGERDPDKLYETVRDWVMLRRAAEADRSVEGKRPFERSVGEGARRVRGCDQGHREAAGGVVGESRAATRRPRHDGQPLNSCSETTSRMRPSRAIRIGRILADASARTRL
jgi:hypothetical protein